MRIFKPILVLAFALVCVALSAQPRLPEQEFHVGFHGGVIAGMMRFNPSVKQSLTPPQLGANAGFVFRYSATKYTAFQMELNYMQRGWREPETNYERHLDYLEIPLLMHLYVGKQVRGFFNFGPQFGYCVAQYTNDVGKSDNPLLVGKRFNPIDKPFDWGLAAGLGLQVGTQKAGLYFLEARFNFSFGDVFSNRATDYYKSSAPMNLSLNLGWLFPI